MTGWLRMIRRLFRATAVLTPIAWTFLRDRKRFLLVGGPRHLDPDQRRDRARRLTEAFEELGTTYIKLAQFLTTRPDFVPPIYIDELQKLQDDVEPAPFEEVEAMIEDEIGDIDETFDWFEEEAISGASIAQVHHAQIDGREVAVKVRRPGLEQLVETDLRNLSYLIPMAVWFLRRLGQESHAESAQGVHAELAKTIREEMDFNRERAVMNELRASFERDDLDEIVVVPEVYDGLSTEAVLTMSYEPGTKVKYIQRLEEEGHDLEEVVDRIAEAYLTMAFTYDVFQADPHQGNLAVNDEGKVVIYDYGIAQRPPKHRQRAFIRFFVGAGMHDASMAVDALIDMGAVDPALDRKTVEQATEIMIKDTAGMDLTEEEIQRFQHRVDETLYDYPLKFPQEVILGFRTTFGVEGLCARMAPNYDFPAKLYDFFVTSGIAEDFDIEVSGEQGGDFDATQEGGVDADDIKEEIKRGASANGKRIVYTGLGTTLALAGALFATVGGTVGSVALPTLAGPSVGLGALMYVMAWRSFRDGMGPMGPSYLATRHRMKQWDDDGQEAASADEPMDADETAPQAEQRS